MFHQFIPQMLKLIAIAILSVPSILATLSRKGMATALIAAKDTRALEKTFKKFEKEPNYINLSKALADVAEVQAQGSKFATCLRVARDPFPKDEMCVSGLVHVTLVANNQY